MKRKLKSVLSFVVGTAALVSMSFGFKGQTVNAAGNESIYQEVIEFEDAKNFLTMDSTSFHDPFLLNDMQKAVDRINLAVGQKEKIAVYGDYDVDGITSTYILFDYLKSLGADVTYYIPDRISEGYGMNCSAIDTLKLQGVTLIITVDVGITATKEVDYAASVGIDVIVTDHHALKETLPEAMSAAHFSASASGG